MPVDAEAWLAERGIRRDPIGAGSDPAPVPDDASPSLDDAAPGAVGAGPDVTARDATRVAAQAAADVQLRDADASATPDTSVPHLEDDVVDAVAFVRRSTSAAPQSEGRVRAKLADRGWSRAVIDQAMVRARRERLVDDLAMATALVQEKQRRGHAPSKIRADLRDREFDAETIDAVLDGADQQDLEAAAFAVASEKAERTTTLEPESAYRRVVGHVVRRGYPEGLARKVAREAVFTVRDPERAAGR